MQAIYHLNSKSNCSQEAYRIPFARMWNFKHQPIYNATCLLLVHMSDVPLR